MTRIALPGFGLHMASAKTRAVRFAPEVCRDGRGQARAPACFALIAAGRTCQLLEV
ncbi:hypothetical protein ACN2XU_18540 [Primorskyibacter sp. 2E107]|uniref:hypothetical protein n=1 Tax=Primorskyibacter sp. 2E107 TaxID=3403458 RepID=UPI003AF73B49